MGEKKDEGGGAINHIAALKEITGGACSKYEALLMRLITENTNLRGQIDVLKKSGGRSFPY